MPLYEHVFLARQDISAQQVDGLIETFGSVVRDQGGTITKTEYWGLKNLNYRIKKNRKAHFALVNIDSPPAAVAEMERQMGISSDIIRFLTIRVDEHETGPSAMMKRGERDDRRGRRDRDGRDRDRDREPRSRDGGRREQPSSPEASSAEPVEAAPASPGQDEGA